MDDAVRREVAEEIGETISSACVYWGSSQFWHEIEGVMVEAHLYLDLLDKPADAIVLTEGQRVQFFLPDDAMRLDLVPWLANILPSILTSDAYGRFVRLPN